MMQGDIEHASSTPLRRFGIFSHSEQTTLKFNILPQPDMRLTFPPRPPLLNSKKRSRAVADIDGEHSCLQKKKRRLRLFLITSRLSPQFSYPATNIVDRGSSKIAVWAKQKGLGRNLLRKAAILNGIRRQSILAKEARSGRGRVLVEQEREEAQLELARLEFNHGSVDTYTRPVHSQNPSVPPSAAVRTGDHFIVSGSPSPSSSRSPSPTPPGSPSHRGSTGEAVSFRSPNEAFAYQLPRGGLPRRDYSPLPPSPLGISNYDVFDVEDDAFNPYAHLDDDDDEPMPNPFDDDEDDDAVPFSPSAITPNSSTTARTGTTQATTIYTDFDVLDHGEPVFGDYDHVEDGADAIWPSTSAQQTSASVRTSMSPNFSALFATSSVSAPKRTDSFAMSPNFRPRMPTKSISPNFPAVTAATAPISPYLISASPAATSPNFMPSTLATSTSSTTSTSPNFPFLTATARTSPNLHPVSMSPNFTAVDTPTPRGSLDVNHATPKSDDIEQERRRQRDLMFMRFGS
jgi:hypothetical protein